MDAALGLAAQGVQVFPCKANKAPITPNGFHGATTDAATIRSWTWDGMIGAPVPEGVIVVDIDPRNSGDATIAALEAAGHRLPVMTRRVETGGGGLHVYLRAPDMPMRSTLGPGVDVKRHGKGYVIVPPSPGYTTRVDHALADAPDWLLDELRVEPSMHADHSDAKYFACQDGTPYGVSAMERELGRLSATPEGGRNNALNRAAYALAQLEAGGELSGDHARDSLALAASRMGLDDAEAIATIASAWAAGLKEPRQAPGTERPENEAVAIHDAPGDPESEDRFWIDWDVDEEEPPFLCHPILPQNAYVLVYGGTEASKSMAWLGILSEGSHRGVKSSVYSLENPAQTDRSRLRRWAPAPENLRLTNQPVDLNDPRQVGRLIEREKEWGADVILLDTYSHAFNSRSEDGNAKAIEFARRVRHIMFEVGCSVIVIDHTGFNGDEPRDASAKRQQVDVAILMAKSGEWRPGEASRFTMTNRKSARFANPFRLSGEIRDADNKTRLELAWTGDHPRWGASE